MKVDRCAVCGAMSQLVGFHMGTRNVRHADASQLVYVCPNCHAQLDRGVVRGFEFESAMADLMRSSKDYAEVIREGDLQNGLAAPIAADILAKNLDGVQTIVECKSWPTIGYDRLREEVHQLKRYARADLALQLVLAVPARMTIEQKAVASSEGVEVWDLDVIATKFRRELAGVRHPVLRSLFLAAAALTQSDDPTPESQLLTELRSIEPGRRDWSKYQKLVGRTFERLFCPPLSPPIGNLPDSDDVNRRDIILPNYAERGFWKFLRDRYAADFIVADAKNYTEEVGKGEALQVLNYLKEHGAGLLGIIVTRKGQDEACKATARECWALHSKMLVILSDEHIERMLRAREAGGPPEDVIRQWVEDFRLSM